MNYKRLEAFRYGFNPPLPCLFNITGIGTLSVYTKVGEGKILNIKILFNY